MEEPDPHGAPGETQTAYFIGACVCADLSCRMGSAAHTASVRCSDARPAMTIGGMYDRARMAVKRYNKGESVW